MLTMVTLPAGLILYHGSRREVDGVPSAPTWFTPSRRIARKYADEVRLGESWAEERSQPHVLRFRLVHPVEVVALSTDSDFIALADKVDALVHPDPDQWTQDDDDEVAGNMAAYGLRGWIRPHHDSDEILLVRPHEHLERA